MSENRANRTELKTNLILLSTERSQIQKPRSMTDDKTDVYSDAHLQ